MKTKSKKTKSKRLYCLIKAEPYEFWFVGPVYIEEQRSFKRLIHSHWSSDALETLYSYSTATSEFIDTVHKIPMASHESERALFPLFSVTTMTPEELAGLKKILRRVKIPLVEVTINALLCYVRDNVNDMDSPGFLSLERLYLTAYTNRMRRLYQLSGEITQEMLHEHIKEVLKSRYESTK